MGSDNRICSIRLFQPSSKQLRVSFANCTSDYGIPLQQMFDGKNVVPKWLQRVAWAATANRKY
jgi:hypothetical protein